MQLTFHFPFIAKPDIGGRGRKIRVITTHVAALRQLIIRKWVKITWCRTIIPYDVELGVFYIRMPYGKQKEKVVSLSAKRVPASGRVMVQVALKQLMLLRLQKCPAN
jgi:hypothetical protein